MEETIKGELFEYDKFWQICPPVPLWTVHPTGVLRKYVTPFSIQDTNRGLRLCS